MEVGRLLADRFEILRPLAEGAMSTVWVAFDRTNNLEVAVKTISLDQAGWRTEVRDRFMKEARLLARGKHEHLVGVRDVGETEDGFLYLVLDLLKGETLAERLARETRLDWHEAVALILGITRGVSALHRSGIVHRDLKPANIVLHKNESGVVPTIIDLGIGKASAVVGDPELCATLTATGQVLGTPQYMSYEQALGQTDIDARADVWALGVMLYEMLAGVRPFEAPNTNAVLAAIRRKEIRPLHELASSVPKSISQIVDICLNTNRSERFPDADALASRLEEVSRSPLESPADPVPTAPKPRRGGFVVAVLAMVAIVSVLSILTIRTRDSSIAQNSASPVDSPSSTPKSLTAVGNASTTTITWSTAASSASLLTTTSATTPPKSTTSARNRTPVSHVDEAGF